MTGQSITSAAEPLLDLERLVAGIRWRRRMWMSLALIGLFLGMVVTVLFPSPPTAVTRVLVVHADDDKADRSVLMETDVALCQTSELAEAALRQINVNKRPGSFLAPYRCVSVTPNVLEITASGKSVGDAVDRAQALADAFIADHIKRTQDAVDAQAQGLLYRRAPLERTLAIVNKTISSTTTVTQLDALYNVRAGLASQILGLGQRAADARGAVPAVTVGTRVVDPARAVPIRLMRSGVTNVAVGLVVGLGIGLAVAAVLCVTRDRPVLRRDIAAELGVSIIAQLPSRPRGLLQLWRRSRHIRERQRVAATLARVVRSAHTPISLLEIGCPGIAKALALDIAEQLTPERPVVVVSDLNHEQLSEVGERSGGAPTSELYLGVGSVGPGTSWVDLGRLGAETLLIVRAGHATTLGLHTIARQLAYSEISAIGVVLVAPDPRDRSDGTLWEVLHTVLRERYGTNGNTPMHGQPPVAPDNIDSPAVLEPSSTPEKN